MWNLGLHPGDNLNLKENPDLDNRKSRTVGNLEGIVLIMICFRISLNFPLIFCTIIKNASACIHTVKSPKRE